MSQIQKDGLPPDFGFWLALVSLAIVIVVAGLYLFFQWRQERSRAHESARFMEKLQAKARDAFAQVLQEHKYAVAPADVTVQRGTDGQIDCSVRVVEGRSTKLLCGEFYSGGRVYFDGTWYLFP